MKKQLGVSIASAFLLLCAVPVFPQQNAAAQTDGAVSADALVQGFAAFQQSDWPTALLFFRKAVTLPDSAAPEVWYMLVMSEMYASEYDAVISDGELFCSFFPDSQYRLYIDYQIGRALHYTGNYDASIRKLGEFCSRNPGHDLYPSALFWMAESLYASFYFKLAQPLYERILHEFPDSAKYTEAVYRLDLISQREREEKLLYLLKVTGEEYLSSKKEYERQLQQYQTEESLGLRRQLNEAKEELQSSKVRFDEMHKMNEESSARISEVLVQNDTLAKTNEELKAKIARLEQQNAQLKQMMSGQPVSGAGNAAAPQRTAPVQSAAARARQDDRDEMRAELENLKRKAAELQQAVDKSKQLPQGGAQ